MIRIPGKFLRHTISRWARAAPAIAVVLATATHGTAAAQESSRAGGEPDTLSEIIVTGTRIARDPNLESTVPVQSIDGETLLGSGDFNIAESINDVPSLLASITSEQSRQAPLEVGANVLDLRGLGSSRTLTLVNGRRHVSGVEGAQSVDIGSIPSALVERVEVMTGGASAIYGADAVSGVVNFILKDDFDGLEVDFSHGLSDRGDADQTRAFVLWGKNFDGGRGNLVTNVEYFRDDGLRFGDRSFTAGGRTATHWPNPSLRFQAGDITDSTPNFQAFYDFDTTGLYSRGLQIPDADSFVDEYTSAFGTAPNLTDTELALIDRAANAPPRRFAPFPTFSITSAGGVVSPGDFSLAPGIDVDGNGVDDCLDSFVGYNNSLDGAGSFGLAGGCWNVLEGGQVVPVQDGLIASNFNQFGGSGILPNDPAHTIGEEDKVAINLNGQYEFTPAFVLFGEAKWVNQSIDFGTPGNVFWDLVYVAPDNPFIPAELQSVADDTGGLFTTRDPSDFGPNVGTTERETTRFVAGVRGAFDNGWRYEVAANHGSFDLESINRDHPINDRLFAALDVTTDGDGNPVCRSDAGGLDYPTPVFDIPGWDGGFYTFTPGAGECIPLNPFGHGAPSAAAVDWVTTTTINRQRIEQTVFSANLAGDAGELFRFQGGAPAFAVGVEHRRETSKAAWDPLALGVVPQDGLDADGNPVAAGTLLRDVSGQSSLVFSPTAETANARGKYDVFDYYVEASAPLLADLPFAHSLVIDGAVRVADYSTIGEATTWKIGGAWAPVQDVTFRVTHGEAIRAPNIFELFSPDQGVTYILVDPCDVNEIPTASDPALRAANCAELGLPADFVDPLSAQFPGVQGGNPDLHEESAETLTAGVILQPDFAPGLHLSLDYWEVEIGSAIEAVSAQDIVNLCVDSSSIDNAYCGLVERNDDPSSPQFGGFTFLRQAQVNFGRLEASGYDIAARYDFDLGRNELSLAVTATKQEKLDRYFDPVDPSLVDPELRELQHPEWAGIASLSFTRGPLDVTWTTRYQSEQLLRGAEVETYLDTFGPSALQDAVYIHGLNGRYALDNGITLRAGINNLTNEKPFITEYSWPTGSRGRYFFLGVNYSR